jgi:hypothetical protein
MTIEQRLEQLEFQNQHIERKNKRLTAALVVMAVAICAVVTMAATGEKYSDFDVVTARTIFVKNDAGMIIVSLGANDAGDGLVNTSSAQGKDLVTLSATMSGKGMVTTSAPNGKELVTLTATTRGEGAVRTYAPNGKVLVRLGTTADDTGGSLTVFNKTGEEVVQLFADEYGNGVVGAFNRKGMGRTLQPGP